MNKTFSIL